MTAPAARQTAHPEQQRFGRRTLVHAVADGNVREWGAGEPLCGTFAGLEPCPPGLFAPAVTCTICLRLAGREHIEIGDPS